MRTCSLTKDSNAQTRLKMTQSLKFTFNPYYENTYVIYDKTGECVIIDPGCHTSAEEKELREAITSRGLKPVYLLNTHCHIDHVLGNDFVLTTWNVPFITHRGEVSQLMSVPDYAPMFGMKPPIVREPDQTVDEPDVLSFGGTRLQVLFTPGHSPASICFYCEEAGFVVAGDVLFKGSIGRTDLPGGDGPTLMKSIFDKLLTLPDNTEVMPGHMENTRIGAERKTNPFIRAWQRGENIF